MVEQMEILLVEDNPQDAEMTMRALRQNNLVNRVRWVKDGAEALECLAVPEAQKPKLVLLDLKMPKVDGIEVLRRMKGDPALRTIPVVIMTSSNEERDVLQTYQLGVNSYIVKPVDFESFMPAIEQAGLYWLLLNQPAH